MNKRTEEVIERIKESKKKKVAGNIIAVKEEDIDILIRGYIKEEIRINRKWEMPNSKTFKIKTIKELIKKYIKEEHIVIDPFANEHSIKEEIKCSKYISNDIDTKYNTDYNLDAQEFLKLFDNNSVDVLLFDPPYSGRQVKECYSKLGKTVTMNDTNSGYFARFKKEIARILKIRRNLYNMLLEYKWNRKKIWI